MQAVKFPPDLQFLEENSFNQFHIANQNVLNHDQCLDSNKAAPQTATCYISNSPHPQFSSAVHTPLLCGLQAIHLLGEWKGKEEEHC